MKQEFSDSILYFMDGNFNKAFNKLIANGIYSDEEIDLLSYICYSSGRFADFINIYSKIYSEKNCKSLHANKHIKILNGKEFIFPNITKIINQSIERPNETYPESDRCKNIMNMKQIYMNKEIVRLKTICTNHIKELEDSTLFKMPFSCGSPINKGPNDKNIKNYICTHREHSNDFFTLGEIFYSKKDFNLAFKYYKLAILFNPNKAIYYGYCAQTIYLSQSLSKSKIHMLYADWLCDRAIRIDPKNPRWHFIRSSHLIVFSKNFEASNLARAYIHVKVAKSLHHFENNIFKKRIDSIYRILFHIVEKNNDKFKNKAINLISNSHKNHFSTKDKSLRNIKLIMKKGIAVLIIGVILSYIGVFSSNYSINASNKTLATNSFNNIRVKTDNSSKSFRRYFDNISNAYTITKTFNELTDEFVKKRYSYGYDNNKFIIDIETLFIALEYNKDYLKELSKKGIPKAFKDDYREFINLYDNFLEISKNVFVFENNISPKSSVKYKIKTIQTKELNEMNNLANLLYSNYNKTIKLYK